MEPNDLYIRIGGRRAGDSATRVVFRLPNEESERSAWIDLARLTDREPSTLAMAGSQAAAELARVIAPPDRVLAMPAGGNLTILLDLREPSLYGLAWEDILQPPFFPSAVVMRYRPRADERVLTPFELPAGLLTVVPYSAPAASGPTGQSLRYFRSFRAARVSGGDLDRLLRIGRFEIAHLRARGSWSDELEGVLHLEGTDDPLSHRALARALGAGRTRLLVLDSSDPAAFAPVADFAQRLLARGGPTTVAVETTAAAAFFDDFYMSIVHDQPLDQTLLTLRFALARFALFLSEGGSDVLRISPLAARLTGEAASRAHEAGEVTALLKEQAALSRAERAAALQNEVAAAESSFERLTSTAQTAYDYMHESGAWEPIAQAQRQADAWTGTLSDLRRRTDRVVNAWFSGENRRVPPDETLRPGQPYTFAVQIGPRSDKSIVRGAVPLPERELERFYRDEGLELRVVIFSRDFRLDRMEASLHLPRPPLESPVVEFPVRSPDTAGQARLRACIYYEQNLLQSILVRAQVAAERPRRARSASRPAIEAEVEFALTTTLRDVEQLSPRVLNILTNERPDGTHTFAVVGRGIRENFDFPAPSVHGPVGEARKELQELCADTRNGNMTYLFGPDNRGTQAQFADGLVGLAELGYELYARIVTAQDAAYEARLRAALGASGARIQISRTRSAQYIFPWALVYDHPIVAGTAKPCPQFLADLRGGGAEGFLLSQRCLTAGCPNANDTAVACPSGFWGFKHFIEQPLSVHAGTAPPAASDLVASITVARPAPFLMAVSRKLQQVGTHQAEMAGVPDLDVAVRDTKVAIGAGLQSPGFGLVYFYCHGGRSRSRTWLGVGSGEELVAADLLAWKIEWPILHPLVLINGCHTVDITPDDLISFNDMLRRCRAAGVIGTEISIPEALARDFGLGFIRRFVGGLTVGEAMREQRLSLLERNNLLGLVYTPYCSTDLALTFA